MNNFNKNVDVICLGQCGGNIGAIFESKGYNTLFINSSEEDLSTIKSINTYHLTNGEGCYKQRDVSKRLLQDDIDNVLSKVDNFLKNEIVLLISSGGGGTGSGLLPSLANVLSYQYEDKIFCPVVILPSLNESIKTGFNAYDLVRELEQLENIGTCFFLSNDKKEDKNLINSMFSELFDGLMVTVSNKSKDGNIDKGEFKELMRTKGASMLFRIQNENLSSKSFYEVLKNSIFADKEENKIIKYVAIGQSKSIFKLDDLKEVIGTPIDTFQTFNNPFSFVMLSGLSFPYNHLDKYKFKLESSEKLIKESLATVHEKKLSSLNFLNDIQPTPKKEKKKESTRDLLLKFK